MTARSDAVRVSVIIPVRDRAELLDRALTCLSRQTVGIGTHEVIVIDDGSTDNSAAVARRHGDAGEPVRVLHSGGTGAVGARCLGVEAAVGDVLAFTDSDCEPDPGWLEAGLAAIDDGADLVQGRTEPTGPVRPLERSLWVTGEDGLYATCNVFYRRSVFDAVGGFDRDEGESLGHRPGRRLRDLGFGEDTLLGWKVRRRGRTAYVPEALVRHHVFPPDPAETVGRAFNAGGFAMLVREVPELRSTFLHDGIWLGSPGRVPVYVAAVLLVLGKRLPAAAALTFWAGSHAQRLRVGPGTIKRKAAALPVALVADLVTAGSLVHGSVAAKRIVL